MSSISNIISNLENELQQLLATYIEKIKHLELENNKLITDIEVLKEERKGLMEELTVLRNSQFTEKINDPLKPIETNNIDSTLGTSDNLTLLLEQFQDSIENDEMEKVHYTLDILIRNPKPLMQDDQTIKKIVYCISNYVIKEDLAGDYTDVILANFIKLLSILRTHHTAYLTHFLKENYPELFESVLYINEPKMIIRFLKLLLAYQFESELAEALAHIIKLEWGFLDSNVSKAEFCFFLWYSFLFDLDQELVDRTEESRKWLDEKNSIFQLYTFMYDCINAKKVNNKQKQKDLILGFEQNKIFDKKETERIVQKVRQKLDYLVVAAPAPTIPIVMKPLQMVESTKLNQLIKDLKLKKTDVLVPFYTNDTRNLPSGGYATVTVYIQEGKKKKKKKQAFVARELAEEINKRNDPKIIRVENYIVETHIQPPIKPKDQTVHTFQWPSTEISHNPDPSSHDQLVLNENSELKKLGYQITGLTRVKRWAILEKAVPTIGLKKVAYTIAYNVRLRKGQKNGPTKFSYAIGEWEYDLDKLKKTYYKKDFTWPSY
ncbi:hypothetical protein BGM25_23830 [Bacillus sp. FJAT-29953]|nr:hypothetical protein [Bacillus sp. FJAT-29953]